MCSLTTGGPEESFKPGGRNGDIEAILFPVQHGMLYFTGMDVLPPFIAWGPARADEETRASYFHDYKKRLLTLEATPPIVFNA
jgi:NAD(P)H dehydrogenase (quinone)